MLTTALLLLVIPINLYFLSTYIRPLEGGRNSLALAVGILGLVYAALHFRATYSLVFAGVPHAGALLGLARSIVGAMTTSMLACMWFKRGARNMLILAGVLAPAPLAIPLVLHWAAPQVALHSVFTSLNFYSLEAWPIGIAIPAVILIGKSRRTEGPNTESDNELISPKEADESGMGV